MNKVKSLEVPVTFAYSRESVKIQKYFENQQCNVGHVCMYALSSRIVLIFQLLN